MLNQWETPLFHALLKHASAEPKPFHIPGHKKGKGMNPEFRDFIGHNALSIDLINIEPLDDLHHPHGIIHEAQELAADAFSADYTFFSVQGTSGAIMTMILSVCAPGDKILVPRNVHKSIMSAIIFAGAVPVFIYPELDKKLGISHGITPASVQTAVQEHPEAKALLVINPTYFGVSADLKLIVDTAHQAGIPVLVDEAHGVHIHFHPDLPLSAMQAGADLAATSVHKLGGSMTQSSVLNVKKGLVDPHHVQAVMSMLTTTSTSYLLLASLDTARKYLATQGERLLEQTIALAESVRKEVNAIPGLYCPGREMLDSNAAFAFDPTKILISVADLGITGYEVEKWLRSQYNIEIELSDLYNILCIISFGDDRSDTDFLLRALRNLSEAFVGAGKLGSPVSIHLPDIPVLAIPPRDAFYAPTETIPFEESAGRIIAEFVMIYPPGIPVLLPGEVITETNIVYIKENAAAGLPVQGPEDSSLEQIRVIKEARPIR
ncbi:arginine decarboxylase [Sinobaca qinghaiensis]|uniref:Arginine decarboxylase n=1 Tax=Sinobaca qinghaiensis TaxID=342944 RepID=A0A419V6E4_9BACL|nr:aminotransferase class I/II-fold pyridoxal phosphate-dependent enzyme [Sinobaca qinghaiensis]RKD75518.1 arginine decarboxylase [Sinobaca qinghaiensis]